MFVNRQIKVRHVILLTVFYKTIPHLRNQAKLADFSPLSSSLEVIKPQMFHNFRVSVTTRGITENRLSPVFAPKLFDRSISSNQHTSGKMETNETLQFIQVLIEIAVINFSVVDRVLLNALQDVFVNKQVKSTVGATVLKAPVAV